MSMTQLDLSNVIAADIFPAGQPRPVVTQAEMDFAIRRAHELRSEAVSRFFRRIFGPRVEPEKAAAHRPAVVDVAKTDGAPRVPLRPAA